MPIYEYRCCTCGLKLSFFTRSISEAIYPCCTSCASTNIKRIPSTFAYNKPTGNKTRQSSKNPNRETGRNHGLFKNPTEIGISAENTLSEFGMEMPETVKDTIQAAREGTIPRELDI